MTLKLQKVTNDVMKITSSKTNYQNYVTEIFRFHIPFLTKSWYNECKIASTWYKIILR